MQSTGSNHLVLATGSHAMHSEQLTPKGIVSIYLSNKVAVSPSSFYSKTLTSNQLKSSLVNKKLLASAYTNNLSISSSGKQQKQIKNVKTTHVTISQIPKPPPVNNLIIGKNYITQARKPKVNMMSTLNSKSLYGGGTRSPLGKGPNVSVGGGGP